jgi:hypothetical protein
LTLHSFMSLGCHGFSGQAPTSLLVSSVCSHVSLWSAWAYSSIGGYQAYHIRRHRRPRSLELVCKLTSALGHRKSSCNRHVEDVSSYDTGENHQGASIVSKKLLQISWVASTTEEHLPPGRAFRQVQVCHWQCEQVSIPTPTETIKTPDGVTVGIITRK